MNTLLDYIGSFINAVAAGEVETYNEFSLQHELGIFLRCSLPAYKVQFERNVNFFSPTRSAFTKREIDISVFSKDRKELKYAIELKYPRNGQYPEQMFSFCKDVAFAEELRKLGFQRTALMIFADDPLFYQGSSEGIYGFFRAGKPLHGRVQKPTGTKYSEASIVGTYTIKWQPIVGPLKYTIIEVGDGQ